MKWYQMKELAAGEKRLLILWYLYKFFGKNFVKFIVFFITLFAFLGAKEPRKASEKYLSIIGLNSGIFNQFRHFLSYSYSLLDRMEVYSGRYNPENLVFDDKDDELKFKNDLENGLFIIGSHLGNIEMMRTFLFQNPDKYVNIFLSADQCKIFNNFIKQISVPAPAMLYPVEEITINTSIEIKEKVSNGDIVIMAGDRISKNSANVPVEFLGRGILLPFGTFKFAYLMECPIYFVCALKIKDKYRIYLKKFEFKGAKKEAISVMQKEYLNFLERLVPLYPFQFYHFYDLFN